MESLDPIFAALEHAVRSSTQPGDPRLRSFVLEVQNAHETETWSFQPAGEPLFFQPRDEPSARLRVRLSAKALRALIEEDEAGSIDAELDGDRGPLDALAAVLEGARNPLSVRFGR